MAKATGKTTTVTAKVPVSHDSVDYAVGESLDVGDAALAQLQAVGAIHVPAADSAAGEDADTKKK